MSFESLGLESSFLVTVQVDENKRQYFFLWEHLIHGSIRRIWSTRRQAESGDEINYAEELISIRMTSAQIDIRGNNLIPMFQKIRNRNISDICQRKKDDTDPTEVRIIVVTESEL